jgi:hypothetical protein
MSIRQRFGIAALLGLVLLALFVTAVSPLPERKIRDAEAQSVQPSQVSLSDSLPPQFNSQPSVILADAGSNHLDRHPFSGGPLNDWRVKGSFKLAQPSMVADITPQLTYSRPNGTLNYSISSQPS